MPEIPEEIIEELTKLRTERDDAQSLFRRRDTEYTAAREELALRCSPFSIGTEVLFEAGYGRSRREQLGRILAMTFVERGSREKKEYILLYRVGHVRRDGGIKEKPWPNWVNGDSFKVAKK